MTLGTGFRRFDSSHRCHVRSDVRAYFKQRKETDTQGYAESVRLLPSIETKSQEKSLSGVYKRALKVARALAAEFYEYRTCSSWGNAQEDDIVGLLGSGT